MLFCALLYSHLVDGAGTELDMIKQCDLNFIGLIITQRIPLSLDLFHQKSVFSSWVILPVSKRLFYA